jgi:ABC-2 type transport system permease protein
MSVPAPLVRQVAAQARVELALTARRGESVLLTLVIPLGLLLFLATVPVLPLGDHPADVLLPGLVALSVLSTGMVGLSIATAFERQHGALKLLGATPLSRGALLTAKVVAVLAIEAVQVGALLAVAALLGWRPGERSWLALPLILAGTAAFSGIGLLLAGRLRAETTLAAANGLYVVLLLAGGMVLPLAELPGPVSAVARVLPAAALAGTLRPVLGPVGPFPVAALVVLLLWAIIMPIAAIALFRWHDQP